MRVVVAFTEPYSEHDLLLIPGQNLLTGINSLVKEFGTLTSLEEDLITFASAVYAADIANRREARLGNCRDFSLTLPVVNHHAFERVKAGLQRVLSFLSDDNWELNFTVKDGHPETHREWTITDGITLLFSGGLDSLACAVDLLDAGNNLTLLSHVTSNPIVKGSQDDLYEYLQIICRDNCRRIAVATKCRTHKGLRFPVDKDREDSQRTRSFLFLVLAAISARRCGHSRVILIAENGQMAIHLPLSTARVGAFSTHTAHPRFVNGMKTILSTLLDFDINIENPYLYLTKAETIQNLVHKHSEAIPLSVSCWRASRVFGGVNHCGECIPCLVRRIANEHNGLILPEYRRDLLRQNVSLLSEDDEGKRHLSDLIEFASRIANSTSNDELVNYYPELIDENYDMDAAIQMYKRFAAETFGILRRYPGVIGML